MAAQFPKRLDGWERSHWAKVRKLALLIVDKDRGKGSSEVATESDTSPGGLVLGTDTITDADAEELADDALALLRKKYEAIDIESPTKLLATPD